MIKQLEHAISFMSELGVPDDVITKFKSEKEEDVADVDLKVLKKTILDKHKTVLADDETFTETFRTQERVKFLATKTKQLFKRFSSYITQDEFDALPAEKQYDTLVELLEKKVNEKKPGNEVEEVKKLNKELSTVKEEYEAYKKQVEEETIPGIKSEVEKERSRTTLGLAIRKEFDKHADKLVADPELLWPSIEVAINSKYDYLTENGKVKVLKKGATTPAYDDKNNEIVFDAFLTGLLKEKKAWKESNGEPAKPPIKEPAEPRKNFPPGLSKAEQRIKEMEAQKAA